MALALAAFRERVANDIGLLGEGVPFEDAYDQLIEDIYTDVYAELEVDKLVDWGSTDAIPNEYVRVMVGLVGARTAPKYRIPPIGGIPWDGTDAAPGEYQKSEKELRRLISKRHRATTTPAEYF